MYGWYEYVNTTESGGLEVKSVVPSGLGCGSFRFEFRNGKRLGLNPTIPTLDPLVLSWGWDRKPLWSPPPTQFFYQKKKKRKKDMNM